MPLQGRVGRHTRHGGRHCQNWIKDQQTVIDLLNRIAVGDGGTGGSLTGKINGRLVDGMASDALYGAISRFESKHFPGQTSGFVDPGGRMLARMEALAAAKGRAPDSDDPPPDVPELPPESVLDILRRNVLDESRWQGRHTAGERVAFDPLVTMAVRHIDSLKSQGFDNLGRPVELFGRAHVFKEYVTAYIDPSDRTKVLYVGKDQVLGSPRPLPEMRYGSPVELHADIVTEKLGALLLYNDGACHRVFPYRRGGIYSLGRPYGRTTSLITHAP